MRHRITKSSTILPLSAVVVILAVFSFSCSSPQSSVTMIGVPAQGEQVNERVQLVTTLYPLEYFAERIGGDLVEVTNLVAPGVEAHDFEPAPSDMRVMGAADVIVYNGLGFEPWMDRALAGLSDGSRIVVEAGRDLAGLAASSGAGRATDGEVDPHVWLDPTKAAKQAENIRDALIDADPDSQSVFEANAQIVIEELSRLDDEFKAGVSSCRLDTFVAAHAAFGHLANRYGLVQVPISGLSPESEPSPGALAELTRRVKETGVKYVLAESIGSQRLPETVAAETGAEVLVLHPLAALTPQQADGGDDFMSVMRENLQTLITALECAP